MLDRLTANLQFQAQALTLRSERQKVLASNIANADTPNYQARDFDFSKALNAATLQATHPLAGLQGSNARHLAVGATAGSAAGEGPVALSYRVPDQASMDRNTVDLDRERANFADNAIKYEATLRFINGNVRSILSAIRGD